ncbi:kinase-like domain-containing protein [Mucor mucedo]|uniref:kinase-like domain-containing protein n=1 Tax=Mucor mucedo TaxID=29922 RepID=UPI00221FF171|nr:kinase-like domain-containing protein [Mucor mucedo]KAI7890533.1 kinase-like domain-containing protein [Mucor mucedo]
MSTPMGTLNTNGLETDKEIDIWKSGRRPSINLLDMTEPEAKSKTLYDSLQKFDPLQPRVDPPDKKKSSAVTIDNEEKLQQATKVTPTRLPTPRRPALSSHVSSEHIHANLIMMDQPVNPPSSSSNAIQLDPTPPSSPGRRIRQTSIARLAKPIVRESLGKANLDLAEFDPLISPVKDKRLSASYNEAVSKSSTKKGVQSSLELASNLMKQEKTSPKQCINNPTTRIPLPTLQRTEQKSEIDETQKQQQIVPQDSSAISRFCNNNDQVPTTTSKLRKPEIIVPKSIKRLPKKEMSMNYHRRPSYPTAANEILQEQWDKEREKSRTLCANLVSAQGLISQPDDENEGFVPPLILKSSSHESRMEKIHDRLQCLVDVGTTEEEASVPEYKKETGNPMLLSAKTALHRFKPFLSPYEKTEILRYPSIYCVGSHAKKHMASTDQTALNYGYDDEKGDYQIVLKDHLNYRYEIVESLGKGSFGQVVKCKDHKPASSQPPSDDPTSSNLVAVKIIRNKKRFHAQAQTEVKILEQLMAWDPNNKHYNVRMMDSFYFRDHLCIVFECLSLNLYEILQQNSYQGFSMGLVKRFGYQILTSLKLLSDHNVIHCDLKPENILLRQPDRSGIRVIDYGSSCYVNEKVYTYIQSRFYRAPEVILGLDYGLPIDMWSTGCILAELYTGRPLFPGENEPDQLACIMQLLGVPDKQYLERCSRKKQFFDMYDQPRKSINSKGKKRRPNSLTFTEALKRSTYDNFDRDFGDFISRCLTWEPEARLKPAEALKHPWVQAMKK